MNLLETLALEELIFEVEVCQIPDEVSTNRFQRGVLGPSDPSIDPAFEDFLDPSLFPSGSVSFELFFSELFFAGFVAAALSGIGVMGRFGGLASTTVVSGMVAMGLIS